MVSIWKGLRPLRPAPVLPPPSGGRDGNEEPTAWFEVPQEVRMETRNLQRQFEVLERYGWKRGAYNVGLRSSGVADGNEET